MVLVAWQLLVLYTPWADGLNTPKRPPHEHQHEMDSKSESTTVGFIPCDPASIQGNITTLDHMNQFLPDDFEGHAIVDGDGLSVLRFFLAVMGRRNTESHKDRLEWVVESPGELHREFIDMQDSFNILWNDQSCSKPGTMTHMATLLGHTSLGRSTS